MTYAPDSSNMPTLAPPPAGRGIGSSNNKRRGPGLKLSFEHLQTPPASSITAVDPATQHNNTFREKVGNIVGSSSRSAQSSLTQSSSEVNVNHVKRTYPGCGADDEDDDGDDSLAAAYLNAVRQTTTTPTTTTTTTTAAMATPPSTTTERRNIPVLREPPQPPSAGPRRSPNTTTTTHHHPHHHHVPVSSTTTSTSTSNATPVSPFSSSSSSSASDANDPDGSHCMDIKTEDLEVIKLLGEGAAGTVRKVLHRPTGRIMAKKTIGTDPNPKVQKQILRELAFQKTCNSPYIVSFWGAFLEDGDTSLSLCMEFCEAGSLEDIYKRARDLGAVIGEPVLERIAESVCKGLVYLQSQHVIHRDIKPSNILVTRKGEIKLCDFGVSGELINSIAKTFTGTKYYMAPERIKGAPYAVQSDIWSLGLTLIEVSQNRPALPPPGQAQLSVIELLELIVRHPVPVIQGDHISKECRNFVAVCLIKDPQERPGPARMLEHPFIKRWEDVPMDVATWVKEVWDWK